MINLYIISTLLAWALALMWVLMLNKDRKKLGIKSKTYTTGQNIATMIQLICYMILPIFNLIFSIYAWFKYDETLSEYQQEVTNT